MTKEEIQKNSEHWYNKYKDAEKRIEELEKSNKEWQRACEAKSNTNSQLTEQLADKVEKIAELEKENAELTCQMKRNIYCYSCKNATEKCYKKEIGCPCGKYESYKDENAELKGNYEQFKAVAISEIEGLKQWRTEC